MDLGKRLEVDLRERIEWVVKHRRDIVKNRSQWARMSGLSRAHVHLLVRRREENPNAQQEWKTWSALANSAKVPREWLATGEGPLPPERVEPGDESTTNAPPLDAAFEIPFTTLQQWAHATPAVAKVLTLFGTEVTVGDLVRYRASPSSRGQHDADDVWALMKAMRVGGIDPSLGTDVFAGRSF